MVPLRRGLTLVAYALLVPVGLAVRLFGDPLGVRRPPRDSNWRPVPDQPADLDRARRLD
ncbi:hypothetical protein V6U90_22920 [Micromonospora sp. CPCC 206060]|uniref:Uncharacterized protein n=1 Tax=Micromonospora echinofusca TaxID=47858 RepID=A0ABS3VWZ1_MICEH|nr:hypothetical protein [Micromonospora echinofusca]MBO4209061.1 hypothetical protein [Micromonospora echinofusca]